MLPNSIYLYFRYRWSSDSYLNRNTWNPLLPIKPILKSCTEFWSVSFRCHKSVSCMRRHYISHRFILCQNFCRCMLIWPINNLSLCMIVKHGWKVLIIYKFYKVLCFTFRTCTCSLIMLVWRLFPTVGSLIPPLSREVVVDVYTV